MIRNKKLAWIFAWIYFASYITRINFAAIIQEVITDTGFTKSALSIILVCISIAYGVGQIINGRIGDKIKPQNLILAGLTIATLMNIIFPFFVFSIPAMAVLWTINGFAQAMMWPPIVKIMVSTMDDKTYGTGVVIVSAGSSVATILIYLVSPLIIELLSWQAVFYICAGVGLITTAVWAIIKDKTYSEDNITKESERVITLEAKKSFIMPKEAIFPFVFIALGIIFQGMLRDGVQSWMPSYLSDVFDLDNSQGILITVSLAVFSLVVYTVAGALYKKFFKNEVTCALVIYTVALGAAALLMLIPNANAVFVTIFMTLISGAAHGVNLMLISHTPKRFKKYGNISTFTGLVNSFTYVGSAIATYGIAKLSDLFGWSITTVIWFVIALLGTLCCVIARPKWKRFMEK